MRVMGINCARCQTENSSLAKFCQACGVELSLALQPEPQLAALSESVSQPGRSKPLKKSLRTSFIVEPV